MKRFALYLGLATALVASCSIQEKDFQTPQQDDVIYYASFEQPAEEGTRVYANEDLLLRWTADDRVSIFGKNTYNQQYKFLGETGDNSGGFSKVDVAEYVTGNPISHTVSVYPYQSSTKITEDEVVTLTLPAEQHYAENTFGLGSNTMVSVSEDNFLQYKNVGGYLMLKLYGEGVTVSSITLRGNNGEKLAGKASVTMPLDGMPTVVMAEDATTEITLTCDTPVALGATADESIDFWLVVPPVSFNKGFTISGRASGGIFEISTSKSITIERSNLSKMSPVDVKVSIEPRNVIYYTSADGEVITPASDVFGANIVSNEYVNERGIITFDGDVTKIGGRAFNDCTGLTSITIPEGVTSIEYYAFNDCTGLTSITIPEGVTSIGDFAFSGCTGLTSITIPSSVTSIGNKAFQICTGFTSVHIPDSVTSIGNGVFGGCVSIMSFSGKYASHDGVFLVDSGSIIAVALGSIHGSISIPDGVTSIGDFAFSFCKGLTSITIPESLTSIGPGAFFRCKGLTSITIPSSVTSIGDSAFSGCTGLTSITIPESLTSIGPGAFSRCTGLTSITVLPVTPPAGEYNMFVDTNNCPIYVPAASVDAYKSAQFWSNYANRIQAIPSIPIPEAVDLGLPSGLKWASFNLGASKPEEYGDYYAWGDVLGSGDGKNNFDFYSYKWYEGLKIGTPGLEPEVILKYNYDSEYGPVDNLDVLEPEDDAASTKLGSSWRMPTKTEFEELRSNCDWVWTTENGVAGMRITSRVSGHTDKSIFLPGAGNIVSTTYQSVGEHGSYWSSCINHYTSNQVPYGAMCIHFGVSYYFLQSSNRHCGFTIRAVTK